MDTRARVRRGLDPALVKADSEEAPAEILEEAERLAAGVTEEEKRREAVGTPAASPDHRAEGQACKCGRAGYRRAAQTLQIDGEAAGVVSVQAEILPRQLRVVAPAFVTG